MEIDTIGTKHFKGIRTQAAVLYRGLEGIRSLADSPEAWNDIYTDGGHGETARATLTQISEEANRLLPQIDPEDPRFVVYEVENARRMLKYMREVARALEIIDQNFSHEGDEASALVERAIINGEGRVKAAIMQLRKEVRE